MLIKNRETDEILEIKFREQLEMYPDEWGHYQPNPIVGAVVEIEPDDSDKS